MKKIIALILLIATIFCFVSCDDTETESEKMGTGACSYATTRSIKGRDIKYVEICFEGYGKCVVLLDATTAPETVANFISLVESGFYNGLTFHRIIIDFMIQGGDPNADGTGGHTDANGKEINIKGEFDNNGHTNDISHKRGVISMARSGNQYYPSLAYNTASSQFFICNADYPYLDGDYAAFGYVIAGLSVVDSVTAATAGYGDSNGGISDKSLQAVIESVVEITEEEAMKYVELSKAKEGK